MNTHQTIEESTHTENWDENAPTTEQSQFEMTEPTDEKSEAAQAFKEAGQHAKQKGQQLMSKAKANASKHADSYVDQTGSKIRTIERATREAADKVRDEEPEFVTQAFEFVANAGDSAAKYFEENSSKKILNDAREFARERPAVVLGGLAAAGFLAGRFLKAEEPEEA